MSPRQTTYAQRRVVAIQCCLALLMLIGFPALAQQGCRVMAHPDPDDASSTYVMAMRDARTLTHEEIDQEIRRVYGYTGPIEPPRSELIRYQLPPQPGLPPMFAFVTAKGQAHRNLFTSLFIPSRQSIEGVASAMCNRLARVEIPMKRMEARPGDRTAPPERAVEVLAPSVPFYSNAAREALAEGGAAITGTACVHQMGQMRFPADMPVYLYPASPYTEQIASLDKKAARSGGRQVLRIADGFIETRLEGRTNAEGRFRFARLKPGRYYLVAQLQSTFYGEREVSIGSYVNAFGFRSYINQTQGYTQDFDDTLERFVEIKPGQTEVNTHLLPKGITRFIGCRQID